MLVAGPPLQFPDVLLEGVPDGGTVGQPERQAGADQRIGVEQVELAAEPAVVGHGTLPDRYGPAPATPGETSIRSTTKPRSGSPGAS